MLSFVVLLAGCQAAHWERQSNEMFTYYIEDGLRVRTIQNPGYIPAAVVWINDKSDREKAKKIADKHCNKFGRFNLRGTAHLSNERTPPQLWECRVVFSMLATRT
jgi:hypothetical protein